MGHDGVAMGASTVTGCDIPVRCSVEDDDGDMCDGGADDDDDSDGDVLILCTAFVSG